MSFDEQEAQYLDNYGENEHQANDPVIDWDAYHTEKLSLTRKKLKEHK